MNIRSAKQKGRRLCERIRQIMLDAAMTLSPDDIIVNTASNNGEDLLLSQAARRVFPVCIEAKNQERIDIWSAIAQAENHAAGTVHTPIVVFSRNRSGDYVVCNAREFFKLMGGQ